LEKLAAQFDDFIEEAHRLKALYAPQITILVGAETEYISALDITSLKELLQRYHDRIEFLVGSVHHVNEIPIDFDLPTFQKSVASCAMHARHDGGAPPIDPEEAMLDRYLDAQYELMAHFRPEVIGHFDLFRLYKPQMKIQEFPAVWEKVKRNVKYFCDYGALVEFNAAAFRKGWETAYPARDIVEVSPDKMSYQNTNGLDDVLH
jgi:histidinol-phosphatase (PHP family)